MSFFNLPIPSRIHTNPKQPPSKTALRNLLKNIRLQRVREGLDYVHWCERLWTYFNKFRTVPFPLMF